MADTFTAPTPDARLKRALEHALSASVELEKFALEAAIRVVDDVHNAGLALRIKQDLLDAAAMNIKRLQEMRAQIQSSRTQATP